LGAGWRHFSAARQLAACDPETSISIVNNEAYPPYDRPPLSKGFLAGGVTLSDLTCQEVMTFAPPPKLCRVK
jgi:NADPH-dependent 2,4-dienoyl-CoA reductase/sulfur reductase-like enzyme